MVEMTSTGSGMSVVSDVGCAGREHRRRRQARIRSSRASGPLTLHTGDIPTRRTPDPLTPDVTRPLTATRRGQPGLISPKNPFSPPGGRRWGGWGKRYPDAVGGAVGQARAVPRWLAAGVRVCSRARDRRPAGGRGPPAPGGLLTGAGRTAVPWRGRLDLTYARRRHGRYRCRHRAPGRETTVRWVRAARATSAAWGLLGLRGRACGRHVRSRREHRPIPRRAGGPAGGGFRRRIVLALSSGYRVTAPAAYSSTSCRAR